MKFRKKQKKIFLEKCVILQNDYDEINRLYKMHDAARLLECLAHCQETAIELGSAIERESDCHGQDTTVIYLEQLCEMIYQLSCGKEDGVVLLDELGEIINIVGTIVNSYEVSNKIEVVFFPYKASMWDSLESIFFAACEDSECDVHVVPIPYYEKSEDGNSLELVCDANLFSDNIPVESWETYKVSERKPDIIFVHNPYDDYNSVTCIKPDYFSRELKKHTDMLVYVPYFFSADEMPDNHIFLPSYRYFDKIIVQNENYKRKMCEFISEDKVMVLGSPKCDRIMSEIENVEIDESWKEKIKGKKVVFFNFSISRLLSDGIEQYLKKIEHFFNLVKEFQNLIVIWRPHPLLDSTINSLRKELKERMIRLKDKFLNECIGIYDTSPNVSAAISVSDVYIGESSSSIMYMFGVVGKPIFIMNEDIYISKGDMVETGIAHLVLDKKRKNIIYFISERYSVVCEYDMITGRCKVLFSLGIISNGLVSGVIRKFDNDIYVLLISEPLVYRYNMLTKQVVHRSLPSLENLYDGISGFGDIIKYKEHLYLLPVRYTGIIQFDSDLKNMKSSIQFPEKLLPPVRKNELWFYSADCTMIPGRLYLTSVFDNSIWEACLDTEELRIHYIGDKNSRYILGWNRNLYLMKWWGSEVIYTWDPQNDELEEKVHVPKSYVYSEHEWKKENINSCFFAEAEESDLIHMVSLKKNQVFKVDKQTGKIIEWHGEMSESGLQEDIAEIFPLINDKYIIKAGNKLILLNEKNKTSCELRLKVSMREIKKYRRKAGVKLAQVNKENQNFDVEDFLEQFMNDEITKNMQKKNIFWEITGYSGINVGKKCYECLKRSLLEARQ